MDEYVVVNQSKSINVYTDRPDVCVQAENGYETVTVRLNVEQARKLYEFLNDAIAELHNED